jgi:D-alanine-D-alanine ligase
MRTVDEIIVIMGGFPALPIERRHSIDYGNIVVAELKEAGLNAISFEICKIEDLNLLIGRKDIIVFNALIGLWGEDGKLASFLEHHNIPYTGCNSLGAKLTFNKVLFKLIINSLGINTPSFQVIDYEKWRNNKLEGKTKISSKSFFISDKTFPLIKYPIMVKTISGGFSMGDSKVENENQLKNALKKASKFGNKILLEEFINGRDAHVPIINGETLPIIETSSKTSDGIRINSQFFDFNVREKTFFIPGRFNKDVISNLENSTKKAYKELNLNGLCRADFVVSDRNEVFMLEINSQHSIRKNRMAINSARAAGYQVIDLIKKILSQIN